MGNIGGILSHLIARDPFGTLPVAVKVSAVGAACQLPSSLAMVRLARASCHASGTGIGASLPVMDRPQG
jgi:hypothetical protein